MPRRLEFPGFFLNQEDKKRRRKLEDIQPFEIALVAKGANRETFTVAKEDSVKFNVDSLERAQKHIGQVVTVCKSGDPSPAVAETLQKDLMQAHLLLDELVQPDKKEEGNKNPSLVKALDLAEQIGKNSNDLNLSDQVSDLMAELKALQASSALKPEAPPTEVKPEVTTSAPAQASPPTEDKQTKEEPAVKPEDTKSTEAAATPPAAEGTAVEPTKEAAPTTEAAAPEVTPEGAAPEITVVTKSDLESFGKELMTQVSALLAERTTVNKSVGVPSVGSNDAQVIQAAPPTERQDVWGSSLDLNAED